MYIYSVVPANFTVKIQDFESLEEAIRWQDELSMAGIRSTIERINSFWYA